MKSLQGLLSFLEAGSAGSFTVVKARLDLTPAAVSKNVQKLEAELGVRLFNRSTRRIRLTTEGEAFALQARDALRALDDGVANLAQGQAEPQRPGASRSAAPLAGAMCCPFCRAYCSGTPFCRWM